MKFKIGDKVKIKYSYNKIVEKYENDDLNFKSKTWKTDDKMMFGIPWYSLENLLKQIRYGVINSDLFSNYCYSVTFYNTKEETIMTYCMPTIMTYCMPVELLIKYYNFKLDDSLFKI